jgi:bifunctional NMN adenylyltransferase/nudix hydrolase
MKKFNTIFYIGRFQPFHNAHKEIIKHALMLSNNVVVLVGSSESPRTIKNPFTFEERKEFIYSNFHGNSTYSLFVEPIKDYPYDDVRWIEEVGSIMNQHCDGKCAVIGHDKDHSSWYLNYFQQYKFIDVPQYPTVGKTIDATSIRNLMFQQQFGILSGAVPSNVENYILSNVESDWFKNLVKEYDAIEQYKKLWSGSPFPPQFVTVDAVVIQSGHVLLVKRGGFPGYGLWALPGGFVDKNETLEYAVVRELKEETKIKVPEKILKRLVKTAPRHVFDDPDRSTRGRTFSHTFLFQLDDSESLPRVKGSDDALEARWVSFSEFYKMQNVMFEDHYGIVNKMLNMVD